MPLIDQSAAKWSMHPFLSICPAEWSARASVQRVMYEKVTVMKWQVSEKQGISVHTKAAGTLYVAILMCKGGLQTFPSFKNNGKTPGTPFTEAYLSLCMISNRLFSHVVPEKRIWNTHGIFEMCGF